MRHPHPARSFLALALALAGAVLGTGCWLGSPYDPLVLCFDTTAAEEAVDGGRRLVLSGPLFRIAERTGEDVAGCDTAPDYIYEIREAADDGDEYPMEEDDDYVYHRLGFNVPEASGPDLRVGDMVDIVFTELDREGETAAAFTVRLQDEEGGSRLVVVGDSGIGGPVLSEEERGGIPVERGDELQGRNGECGRAVYHYSVIADQVMSPGTRKEVEVPWEGVDTDVVLINVDDRVWEDVGEGCEDPYELLSYMVVDNS